MMIGPAVALPNFAVLYTANSKKKWVKAIMYVATPRSYTLFISLSHAMEEREKERTEEGKRWNVGV